jgi:DNA mismatch repair protein MSH6
MCSNCFTVCFFQSSFKICQIFISVVKREICQISSTGTRTQSGFYESQFLTAICAAKAESKIKIGIAFVDTSIGTFHIANFDDDNNLSR